MRLGVLLAVATVLGCGKPSAEATPPGGSGSALASAGSAVASAGGASASSATPTTGSSASAAAGAGAASSSWTGTYKSSASAVSVPPEWKKVHWSDTQSTQGVGDGTLTLAVDGATGRVSGSVDGPLGPAVLDGAVSDGKLSATLLRRDPADQGFTGTLLATVAGDKVEGTISASPGGGGMVRTATFSLARAAAH